MLNRSNLHKYQTQGVEFILEKRKCALFLFLGAGKTITTLTAISDMIDSFISRKILIIAPLHVANTVWKQEAEKWRHTKHLKISICTGPAQQRLKALKNEADIYIINRENVPWLVDECKTKKCWPFDTVIVDESSSFKNHSTKRFRKLKSVLKYINAMVLLTGTPSPNGLLDLWSQLFLIDQGESLGKTITGYRKRFFDEDYWGHSWTAKEGSQAEIQDLIRDKVLSMKGEDYLELPDRIELNKTVTVGPKVMKDYDRFKKDLIITLGESGEELEAANTAVLTNKLLQWANGTCYTDDEGSWVEIHNEKLVALGEIIEDNPNENILVAYNYKIDLIRLKKHFKKAFVLDKNPGTIDRWNDGKIKLLLAHPASCGHGINLQHGGSMLVWFGLNWSLELYQQMNARLYRQGQTKPVRIVHIVSENTVDEQVLTAIANKTTVQKELLDALKHDFEKLKMELH